MTDTYMTARDLLLSRRDYLRICEVDGDILLRIDGTYAEGWAEGMAEWWAEIIEGVLDNEDDRRG